MPHGINILQRKEQKLHEYVTHITSVKGEKLDNDNDYGLDSLHSKT